MAMLPGIRGGLIIVFVYLVARVALSSIVVLIVLAGIAAGGLENRVTEMVGLAYGIGLVLIYAIDIVLLILFLLRSRRFAPALLFGTVLGYILTVAPPVVEQVLLGAAAVPQSYLGLLCGLGAYQYVVRSERAKTVFVH